MAAMSGGMSGNALPVLHEIAALLEKLMREGKGGGIDLGSMPMSPGDRVLLKEALGQGEVVAEIDALGLTHLRETAIRGVWWVRHCDAEDRTVAELIEVTHCPALLATPEEEIGESLRTLRGRLGALPARRDADSSR